MSGILERLGVSANRPIPRDILRATGKTADGEEISITLDDRTLAVIIQGLQLDIFKTANALSQFTMSMGETSEMGTAEGTGELFIDTDTQTIFYDAPAKKTVASPVYAWVPLKVDATSISHKKLTDIGVNTHEDIDDFIESRWDDAAGTLTSSATLDTDDANILHRLAASSDITVGLPAISGALGMSFFIANTGVSGKRVTINPDGTETIGITESSLVLEDGQSVQLTAGNLGWYVNGIFIAGLDTVVQDLATHEALDKAHPWDVGYESAAATLTEYGKLYLVNTASGSFTVTLPTAAGQGGKEVIVKKTTIANTLTIACNGSQTIDKSATQTITAKDGFYRFISDNSNWRIVGQ